MAAVWVGDAWDSATAWVGDVVQATGELIEGISNIANTKLAKIVKNVASSVWNMTRGLASSLVALGVNAVPLPLISQGVALGFAAKAGYHFGNVYKSLTELYDIIFNGG